MTDKPDAMSPKDFPNFPVGSEDGDELSTVLAWMSNITGDPEATLEELDAALTMLADVGTRVADRAERAAREAVVAITRAVLGAPEQPPDRPHLRIVRPQ